MNCAVLEGGNALLRQGCVSLSAKSSGCSHCPGREAQGWHSTGLTGLVAQGSLQSPSVSLRGRLCWSWGRGRHLWHSPTDPPCLCCSNMCRWQLLQVLIQPKRGMLKGCVRSVPRNDRRQALTEWRGVHGSKYCLGHSTPLRDSI